MTQDQRRKNQVRIIELAYDSLKSHLYWTYRKSSEGKKFHIKCIKDYAEQIMKAAESM